MAKRTRKQMSAYAIIAAVIVAVVAGALFWKPGTNKNIDNFQACKDAGGMILESYPEQCKIDDKSFTNTAQSAGSTTDAYIGLSEQAALDKAKAENKPARVVERDGEALPVTMDYVQGRLNLYVKDGNVYKVQVEGS